MGNQRKVHKRGAMSEARAARLEAVEGWVWDQTEAEWEEGFARLLAYVAEHGDARVPSGYKASDGAAVGIWVSNQRVAYKRGAMSEARAARLEAVVGWAWDQIEAKWEALSDADRSEHPASSWSEHLTVN